MYLLHHQFWGLQQLQHNVGCTFPPCMQTRQLWYIPRSQGLHKFCALFLCASGPRPSSYSANCKPDSTLVLQCSTSNLQEYVGGKPNSSVQILWHCHVLHHQHHLHHRVLVHSGLYLHLCSQAVGPRVPGHPGGGPPSTPPVCQ